MAHPIIRSAAATCLRGLTRARRPLASLGRPPLLLRASKMDWACPPLPQDPQVCSCKERLPYSPFRSSKGNEYLGVDADLSPLFFKPDSPWGLAVYRTCYDDEPAWQKLIAQMNDIGTHCCWPDDGLYMPGRHQLVINNDRAQWDGAERVTVRDHYAQWAREEMERNMTEEEGDDPESRSYPPNHLDRYGPRYNIFGIIDDVCIESIYRRKPLVMLVRRDWKPMTEEEMRAAYNGEVHEDFEHGIMYDHTEGSGGWIYVGISDYISHYGRLETIHEWDDDTMFMYPSSVYCGVMGMNLERSPGFWREEMAAKKKLLE